MDANAHPHTRAPTESAPTPTTIPTEKRTGGKGGGHKSNRKKAWPRPSEVGCCRLGRWIGTQRSFPSCGNGNNECRGSKQKHSKLKHGRETNEERTSRLRRETQPRTKHRGLVCLPRFCLPRNTNQAGPELCVCMCMLVGTQVNKTQVHEGFVCLPRFWFS